MSVAHVLPSPELDAIPVFSLGLGGLRAVDGRVFPLSRVRVRASLAGPCGQTVIEQHFANPYDEALDVTWIFPLPADGALVDLELRAGDVRAVGECQERTQAEATFKEAQRSGKRAALVEKEGGDVHTLSLAGLPPRSDVIVRITLVQLIPSIDGRFRWQFPTTIAPRYTPGEPIGHLGFGIEADTDAVPNASRLSPPLRLEGGTELDLEVQIAGPVSALESSLHAVRMQLDSGSIRVAPSQTATLNKDFILEYSTAGDTATATRGWTDGSHTLVLLEPPIGGNSRALPRDAVFAVDISGSMEGPKLDAARKALRGALHGLRTGDRFRLMAFDDRIDQFAADFSVYDDQNLAAADVWITKLRARGGTEMLPVVQESLKGASPDGRVRTVLLITDGQSTDENRLVAAVANRRGNAVLFTLGIDTAVNATLLKALARAGGGVCELCTPSDDIDAVVARLEGRFGSALLSDIKVAGAARPEGQTVFAGRPAALLLDGAPESVHVTGTGLDGAFEATAKTERIAFPLGALWAMERVSWLEDRLALKPFEEEAIRPEIVRVALQWHIGSKFTAFVCVDHSTVSDGNRRHVVQPTEMPEAWEMEMRGVHMPRVYASPAPPMRTGGWAQHDMAAFSEEGSVPLAPMPAQWTSASLQYESSPGLPELSAANMRAPGASAGGGVRKISEAIETLFSRGKRSAHSDKTKSASPRSRRAKGSPSERPREMAGELARSQQANGSFGGDAGRTAAALLVLLLAGSTRRKGDRRRAVQKAADWLALHAEDTRAQLALGALSNAELQGVSSDVSWRALVNEGPEGQMLAQLLDGR